MSKLKEWYCKHQNAIKIGAAVGIGGLLGFGAGYLIRAFKPDCIPINLTDCDATEIVVRKENVATDLSKDGVFENIGRLEEWWATSTPENGTITYAMLHDIPIDKCGELGVKYSEAAQKCGYGPVNTIDYLYMLSESKGGTKCPN